MSDFKRVQVILIKGPHIRTVKVLDGPKYVAINWAKAMLRFHAGRKRVYQGSDSNTAWYIPNGTQQAYTAEVLTHVLHTRDEPEFGWADHK